MDQQTDKKLRVLFAPSNLASMHDITMEALSKLDGVEVRGLSKGDNLYSTFGKNWTIVPLPSYKSKPFRRIASILFYPYLLYKNLKWADIVMWQWKMDSLSFFILKWVRKKIYIEWLGSEIRVPEKLFAINTYYKQCWESGTYSYYNESKEQSELEQTRITNLNGTALLSPEMTIYLNNDIIPSYRPYFQRINVYDFQPEFHLLNKKPILTHTPSATGAKGTEFVREVIQRLKDRKFDFTYNEITGKSRQEALRAIANADIFIDQFIIGGYGLATCEAMAMGKPVLCYLMPKLVQMLPSDCPIVNASIDTMEEGLATLITDASLRLETGKRSRAYVEKYHNANKIAVDLMNMFRKDLGLT